MHATPMTWRDYAQNLSPAQKADLAKWDQVPDPGFTADRHRTGMIAIAQTMAHENKDRRSRELMARLRRIVGDKP